MSLEGHASAIPVARLVLDRSVHAQLAGEGASAFAASHGLAARDPFALLTPYAAERYDQWRRDVAAGIAHGASPRGHTDTVGVLALDGEGRLAAGVATSGMQFKTHGRVGDSPVVGAGLYAQDGVGAAAATGDGDRMVRHCIAVRVIDLMAAGMNVSEACQRVVMRVHESDPICQAAVVALGVDGNVGAASTHRGFHVCKWIDGEYGEIESISVSEGTWAHSCV